MPTVYQCDVCGQLFKRYGDGYHLYHAPGDGDDDDLGGLPSVVGGGQVIYSRTQIMVCSTNCLIRAIDKLEEQNG